MYKNMVEKIRWNGRIFDVVIDSRQIVLKVCM